MKGKASLHPPYAVQGRLHRRGFLVLDTVAGIVLALFLLMVMTVAVVKQERRQRELSEVRAAARAAETALLTLESGGVLPANVRVEALPGEAIGTQVWVRVTTSVEGHDASLIGLVDQRLLAAGGKTR